MFFFSVYTNIVFSSADADEPTRPFGQPLCLRPDKTDGGTDEDGPPKRTPRKKK